MYPSDYNLIVPEVAEIVNKSRISSLMKKRLSKAGVDLRMLSDYNLYKIVIKLEFTSYGAQDFVNQHNNFFNNEVVKNKEFSSSDIEEYFDEAEEIYKHSSWKRMVEHLEDLEPYSVSREDSFQKLSLITIAARSGADSISLFYGQPESMLEDPEDDVEATIKKNSSLLDNINSIQDVRKRRKIIRQIEKRRFLILQSGDVDCLQWVLTRKWLSAGYSTTPLSIIAMVHKRTQLLENEFNGIIVDFKPYCGLKYDASKTIDLRYISFQS